MITLILVSVSLLKRFPPDLNGGIPKGLGMSESWSIDSPLRGWAMPRSYSGDLRERVIEAVESGASRRETAERFEVSVSSAIKWVQRWHESKSAAPKPRGGSVSPLEAVAEQILDLIAQQPDLTLVETVTELRKRRIRTLAARYVPAVVNSNTAPALFSAKGLARIIQFGPVSNHFCKLIETLDAGAVCDVFVRSEAAVKLAFLVNDDRPG